MVVKCDKVTRDKILKNKSNLKDKKNDKDKPYYVNKQLPEEYVETNREIRELIRNAKKKAADEGCLDSTTIKVKDHKVYVNKQPVVKQLLVPKPQDLFLDRSDQERIDKIKLHNSDTKSEQGSSFTAFAAKCSNIAEVRRGYTKMKQLFSDADHIVAAFINRNSEGFQDDREFGAGHRVLTTLKEQNSMNIAVFVVRRFGGKTAWSQPSRLL